MFFSRPDRQYSRHAARDNHRRQPAGVQELAGHGREPGLPAVRVLAENQLAERTVGVTDALLETRRAFDGVAPIYDQSNAENAILVAMRQRTRAAIERFAPGG